jgi:hypothetical protein
MVALDALPAVRRRLEELKADYPGKYDALLMVVQALQGVPYVLAGSNAAYLHGLDLAPHDIDILTSREGAYLAHERLKEHVQMPVAPRDSRDYSSHLGIYRIKGTKVEVMGDLVLKRPPISYSVPFSPLLAGKAQVVELEGVGLPLVPPEDEVIAAALAEAGKHRERLPHWLRVQPLDASYLEGRMVEMGIPPRFRTRVREECGLSERTLED